MPDLIRELSAPEGGYGEQLKAIIESVNVGVSVVAYDGGELRLAYANERYYSLFGYTKEQFSNELASPHDLILAEDYGRVAERIEAVKSSRRSASFRYRARRRDGGIVAVRCASSVAPIPGLGDAVLLSVLTDVSEVMEAEEQLKRSRDRISDIMDSTPAGIAVVEVEPENITGTMHTTYYNDRFFAYTGYEREDYDALLRGNELYFVHEADRSALIEATRKMCAGDTGESREVMARCRTSSGIYRWLLLTGQLAGRRGAVCILNIVLVDVTNLKEAEDRLRVNEEVLRVAAETDRRALIIYNVKERTCRVESRQLYSASFGEVIEGVPESLLQRGLVAEESAVELRALFDCLNAGRPHSTISLKLRTGQDEYQWFECNASSVNDMDGKPGNAILVFHNITEQRIKEAVYKKWQLSIETRPPESYTLFRCNLSRNGDQYEREGKLIKFKFPTGDITFNKLVRLYVDKYVAPDDREGYLSLMSSEMLLSLFYRGEHTATLEYREIAEDGAPRWRLLTVEMVEYVNSSDVQAFIMYEDIDSRKREQQRTRELTELDALTGALNRAAFAKRADELIKKRPEEQHALLMLDMDGFKLLNDNLGHAVGDQALCDITAILRSLVRSDDLVCRLGGDEFLVWLCGMPYDAAIEKKAQKLSGQLRKSYSLNVQLSASMGIAVYPRDGHDFDELYRKADTALYRVKNLGRDSYAFFSTSLDNRGAVESVRSPASKLSSRLSRRMLIIDDNASDRALLTGLFQDDYQIELAKNGRDALISLRHFGSSLTVVLLDLLMPGIDGFEVLSHIQSSVELRTVPVVVVSSDGDEGTSLRAIKCGAADFVTKPVDPNLIRLRVQSAVSKAENERLRAQNSYLQLQRDEEVKLKTVLSSTGTVVVEYNWRNHVFLYDETITKHIAGSYDRRSLWSVFLTEMVATAADVKALQELLLALANDRSRESATSLVMLRTPTKEKHWFRINIYKQVDDFGLAEKMIITFNDVHNEVLAYDKLTKQATRDELTGLYNRSGFIQKAEELLSQREPGYYMMACVDIEKFKIINDQYGAKKGDEALRAFAGAIDEYFSANGGLCCRVMADIFAILYPVDLLKDPGFEAARRALERPMPGIPALRFCVGRCLADEPELDVSALYDRAAIARDTIKGRYDVNIAEYDESMRTAILRQQEIIGQMGEALERGEFEVWLQPQFDHLDGRLYGAEALARWRHPSEGLIPPSEFIPVFERSGFIYELDKYIWEESCRLLREWLSLGLDPVPVSVNVSRYDVYRDDLIDVITGLLHKYSLPVNLLRIEITESAFADATEQITAVVERLVKLGFIVEIDDFGSGYSSLNTLKDVSAQVIKLDMRFLDDGRNANRGGSIIESIVQMARRLGTSVIAEGVETPSQAEFLREVGCRYVQGFLYSRPKPAGEYGAELHALRKIENGSDDKDKD